ncbi:hypothetical protein [Chryseolinea lacunae]|uniref:Lipoprotein n=1 Tax=Chryseolinea lacunae TaxID=2801331 RepID=A0ABS1KYB9_9BACT|nr:hypothetical protein [Chryseolinea lacunae]MBL0744446.1 hypothetical protein [Chryseolinea lacunae]
MMHKGFGLLASLALLLGQGCEPEVELIRTFVTRQGEHYALPRVVESLQSRTLAFDAMFNETAIYDFGDPALQSNKNKLLGFSDCNSLHHENSARFAWQWLNGRLEIYAYCYANRERLEQFVGVVDLNEFNHYRIEIREDHYAFFLNNDPPVFIKRGNTCERGVYYMLWPYFGGHIPAPHNVQIFIRLYE